MFSFYEPDNIPENLNVKGSLQTAHTNTTLNLHKQDDIKLTS